MKWLYRIIARMFPRKYPKRECSHSWDIVINRGDVCREGHITGRMSIKECSKCHEEKKFVHETW
jgi:hypothetical protein